MGTITLEEQAAPSTPSANKVVVYAKTDGRMYSKDDAGTETGMNAAATETSAGIVELATQAEVNAMTDTTRVITPNHNKIVLGTEAASTSGTAVDFTGIPSGVRKINVSLVGVSTSGTSVLTCQIGAGGVENTGYSAAVGNSTANNQATTGFDLTTAQVAAGSYSGLLILVLEDSSDNTWTFCGHVARTDSGPIIHLSMGSKALSAVLDRVRITTTGGTDTFDAGAINISYER